MVTDINVDELIAEARESAEAEREALGDDAFVGGLLDRLADALEQVQGSADEWWKQYTREVERSGAFWAAIYSAQMGADHPVSFEEWMAGRDYEDARDRLVNGVRVQREYAEKCEAAFKAQRAQLETLSTAPADALRAVRAEALTQFADEYERIHARVKHVGESPDYWRGTEDAHGYFVAYLRSHAGFLVHGHEEGAP